MEGWLVGCIKIERTRAADFFFNVIIIIIIIVSCLTRLPLFQRPENRGSIIHHHHLDLVDQPWSGPAFPYPLSRHRLRISQQILSILNINAVNNHHLLNQSWSGPACPDPLCRLNYWCPSGILKLNFVFENNCGCR